ncbi:hypothetical protein AVEN_114482-1, partial [Araneus ventricosus]
MWGRYMLNQTNPQAGVASSCTEFLLSSHAAGKSINSSQADPRQDLEYSHECGLQILTPGLLDTIL